jgi:hypothetical protein
MRFDFFKGETLTPDQKDIQKQRKEYEKYASKSARDKNTFIENVTQGETTIKKEDVIEIDAHVENYARNLLKMGKINEKNFSKLVNNTLEYKMSPGEWGKIFGKINDQEIKIKHVPGFRAIYRGQHYSQNTPDQYKGTINGKVMTDEDAENLYNELSRIMDIRDEKIWELKNELRSKKAMRLNQEENEKENRKKIKQQRIADNRSTQTKNDIEKII